MLRDDSSILDGQHLDLQAVLGGVLPDEPAQLEMCIRDSLTAVASYIGGVL